MQIAPPSILSPFFAKQSFPRTNVFPALREEKKIGILQTPRISFSNDWKLKIRWQKEFARRICSLGNLGRRRKASLLIFSSERGREKILHFDFHSFLLSLFPNRKYWREEERERKRYWKKRKGWGVTEETIFLLPPSHFPRFSFFPSFYLPLWGKGIFLFFRGTFSLPTGSPRLGGISRGRREAGKNTDFDLSLLLLLLLRPRFLIVFLSPFSVPSDPPPV